MFFKAQLVKELKLEPQDMGKRIQEMVHARLKEAVEGKLIGNSGFVISVLNISDDWMGKGALDNSTGGAVYKVGYEAIVFRPFKNEVLDVIVSSVNAHGFVGSVGGMLDVFVHRTQMPMNDPEDPQTFSNEAWVSLDGETSIKAGCGVRLRVMAIKFHPLKITGIGTIKDHYCGLLFTTAG